MRDKKRDKMTDIELLEDILMYGTFPDVDIEPVGLFMPNSAAAMARNKANKLAWIKDNPDRWERIRRVMDLEGDE